MENGVDKTTVTCNDNQGNGGIETHGSWPGVETHGSWPGVDTHGNWPGVDTHGNWPGVDTQGHWPGQQGNWPGIMSGQYRNWPWPGQFGNNIQQHHHIPWRRIARAVGRVLVAWG